MGLVRVRAIGVKGVARGEEILVDARQVNGLVNAGRVEHLNAVAKVVEAEPVSEPEQAEEAEPEKPARHRNYRRRDVKAEP